MSYRIIAALVLLVALDLATATAARALSVADADHTMRAMDLRMRALNAARKNLQRMENRGDDHEVDAAREIADADVAVFAAAVKVFTVAYLVKGLKCPDDAGFLQQQFGVVARGLVATADEELSRVNGNLHQIAAPAAVAEATRIRDAMIDLQTILKPFVTDP